jgi:hypothetical protein
MIATFTYQGFNMDTGLAINNAVDYIQINPVSGIITIKKYCLNLGTHTIKVVGTLPNQFQFAESTFTLIGVRNSNKPAQFMAS